MVTTAHAASEQLIAFAASRANAQHYFYVLVRNIEYRHHVTTLGKAELLARFSPDEMVGRWMGERTYDEFLRNVRPLATHPSVYLQEEFAKFDRLMPPQANELLAGKVTACPHGMPSDTGGIPVVCAVCVSEANAPPPVDTDALLARAVRKKTSGRTQVSKPNAQNLPRREGYDYHAELGARLAGVTFDVFMQWKESNPEEFKRFRQRAMYANFGLVHDTVVGWAQHVDQLRARTHKHVTALDRQGTHATLCCACGYETPTHKSGCVNACQGCLRDPTHCTGRYTRCMGGSLWLREPARSWRRASTIQNPGLINPKREIIVLADDNSEPV